MTVRELRELLYHMNNQEMTVKELRNILFNVENQDDDLRAKSIADHVNLLSR
jgi:hypothetical protein